MNNIEIFDSDNHIKIDVLEKLIAGTLDENTNYIVSEHLSTCDYCILKYTDMLCDDMLINPPTSLKKPIMVRIKNRAKLIFFNKYCTVAVAAAITICIWAGGLLPEPNLQLDKKYEPQKPQMTNSMKINKIQDEFNYEVDQLFNNILKKETF